MMWDTLYLYVLSKYTLKVKIKDKVKMVLYNINKSDQIQGVP